MTRLLAFVCCLLLTCCERHTTGPGPIVSQATGAGDVPTWLVVLSVLAVVSLAVCVVLFLKGDQADD